MSALDAVVAAVEGSEKLHAGQKALVVAFLRAAGPAVLGLGEEGLNAVLGVAASGGDVSQAVVDHLDARGVAGMLAQTEVEMATLAERHAAEAQAAREAWQTLQAAALMVLARVVMGAL